MKYPNIRINYGSYISKGCQIMCSDNSEMVLKNVHVTQNVVLRADDGGVLRISETYIGYGCVIAASEYIEINEHCEIAEMVVIRDQDHIFGTGELLSDSGLKTSPITIGRNVWLGAKATILKGTQVGDNAVIAAHAVVTKDVPANHLALGVPAVLRPILAKQLLNDQTR
ncbi:MAG: acyltransferase [Acidobacteria bacterium]|nr:acyltransferase [Acidobacteriota bacterium]